MGKVLKIVAIVVAVAVIAFAPQIAAAIASALAISSAIATAVIATTLAIAASVALNALMAPSAARPSAAGAATPTVFRQSIANSFILYGRRRIGGLLAFFHARKVGSDHFRYFAIAIAGHHIQGNPDWMLNDEVVTVDGGGAVTSGAYAGAAWLWLQLGEESETANATFVAESDGRWTSAHKGNGIAAIYAKFKMTDAAVQAGMPNITAVVDGHDLIFDPRDGSTGYSNNAVLAFYHWMALSREEGGFGAYEDEIPDPIWISAQANVCDELVEGEARYAVDAWITTGAAPSEVRDTFVANCAGSYAFVEGVHLMRPGHWVEISETLEEGDLAGPIQVTPFLTSDKAANEIQGTYVSPTDGYQGMPFGTQSLAGDDIRQANLDLAFVTSKYRAERIASIMLKRAGCEKAVVWPMNIMGLKVSALDTVGLATARYGLSNYAWVVTNWSLSADFGVVLNLREENPEIYDDPAPIAAASVPAISQGEPVTTTSDLIGLISTSFTTDADPPDGLLQATDTTIAVETHTRTYTDKAPVSVTGSTITSLTTGTFYHVFYDDPERTGGGVSYQTTTDPQDAATAPTNPGRHYVGSIVAGAGNSAGGASPPGWSGDTWQNVEP
jgi:hypothetical protein